MNFRNEIKKEEKRKNEIWSKGIRVFRHIDCVWKVQCVSKCNCKLIKCPWV